MRLGLPGGNAVTVAITGYQWPDCEDPVVRCAWRMVGGQATDEHGSWDFSWQALTGDEAPLVSSWLREVADWLDASGNDTPKPKDWRSFPEPNLAFRLIADERRDETRIDIDFGAEFKPPQLGQDRRAGRPYTVSVLTDAVALRTAADDWDRERAPYPDCPDWPAWDQRPRPLLGYDVSGARQPKTSA